MEKVFHTRERQLGGGAGCVGVYGSLAAKCMSDVFSDMPSFGRDSVMVDAGCGLGRPQAQALAEWGISCSIGVEVDSVKCDRAVTFIQRVAGDLHLDASGVKILCADSSTLPTLDPCTHLYLCWQGWAADDKAKMGRLVKESASVFCVCTVQHNHGSGSDAKAYEELQVGGWPEMRLVKSRRVHLEGSRETLYARTYVVVGRSLEPGTRQQGDGGLLSVVRWPPHQVVEGRVTRQRGNQ